MNSESNKSVDLLGVKGLADSARILTQGAVDGAGALLGRICLPAAEELGELFRDRVKHWRLKQLAMVTEKARPQIERREKSEGPLQAPPSIAIRVIDSASLAGDGTLQDMWAGLLVSSCTPTGTDDSNLLFVNMVSAFSPAQARLFDWIAKVCPMVRDKEGIVQGDHFKPSVEDLLQHGQIPDLGQLDAELSGLFAAGVFHKNLEGSTLAACKGLSSLGVTLSLRVLGKRGNPADHFDVPIRSVSSHAPPALWG